MNAWLHGSWCHCSMVYGIEGYFDSGGFRPEGLLN
jgi:hypothetical protein